LTWDERHERTKVMEEELLIFTRMVLQIQTGKETNRGIYNGDECGNPFDSSSKSFLKFSRSTVKTPF
jgi:hypothetical protein